MPTGPQLRSSLSHLFRAECMSLHLQAGSVQYSPSAPSKVWGWAVLRASSEPKDSVVGTEGVPGLGAGPSHCPRAVALAGRRGCPSSPSWRFQGMGCNLRLLPEKPPPCYLQGAPRHKPVPWGWEGVQKSRSRLLPAQLGQGLGTSAGPACACLLTWWAWAF